MNYENSKNETEILSADDVKLRELCCSLKKIEAPRDFDFKLKARIASSNERRFQPRFGFVPRYSLPALALILVFGLLAFKGGFLSPGNNQIAARGATETSNPVTPQNPAITNFIEPPQTEGPGENVAILPSNKDLPKASQTLLAGSKPTGKQIDKKREVRDDNFSQLKSVSPPPRDVRPNGFDRTVPQNLPDNPTTSSIKVKDVLLQIGIVADFENGKWKVKSVAAGGVGETSGVKANDVIEAIDDYPLSTEKINSGRIDGKNVTVTRAGEKSQIRLRGKQ
jgi:hypothetical protein